MSKFNEIKQLIADKQKVTETLDKSLFELIKNSIYIMENDGQPVGHAKLTEDGNVRLYLRGKEAIEIPSEDVHHVVAALKSFLD